LVLFDLDIQRRRFASASKLERSVREFETYIRNNQKFIPNFGERYRQGDLISTAFVESTINQVVSKRFVKKQQMVRHEVARRNERMSTLLGSSVLCPRYRINLWGSAAEDALCCEQHAPKRRSEAEAGRQDAVLG